MFFVKERFSVFVSKKIKKQETYSAWDGAQAFVRDASRTIVVVADGPEAVLRLRRSTILQREAMSTCGGRDALLWGDIAGSQREGDAWIIWEGEQR